MLLVIAHLIREYWKKDVITKAIPMMKNNLLWINASNRNAAADGGGP